MKWLRNWWQTKNTSVPDVEWADTKHVYQIVRERHSREKLGTCTVTNFLDDKVSRDAAVVSVNINGQIASLRKQRVFSEKASDAVLTSATIEMPDDFVPPPTKVDVKNVILVDGENVSSPSLPNKNVHDKYAHIRKTTNVKTSSDNG